jgi:hypothetical protein
MWDVLLRFRSSWIWLHTSSCENTKVSEEPASTVNLDVGFSSETCSISTGNEFLRKMTVFF